MLDFDRILLFLVQLGLLLGFSRILGEVFKKWKQPRVTAEIIAGIILGPTILGRVSPELQGMIFPPDILQKSMLQTVALIGGFFLLLDAGLK